jgi:hypothetical protein
VPGAAVLPLGHRRVQQNHVSLVLPELLPTPPFFARSVMFMSQSFNRP